MSAGTDVFVVWHMRVTHSTKYPWGLPLTFTNRGRNVFRDNREDHKSQFIRHKFGSSLSINFPETFAAMSYFHTNWRDLEVRMCKFCSLQISVGWIDPLQFWRGWQTVRLG